MNPEAIQTFRIYSVPDEPWSLQYDAGKDRIDLNQKGRYLTVQTKKVDYIRNVTDVGDLFLVHRGFHSPLVDAYRMINKDSGSIMASGSDLNELYWWNVQQVYYRNTSVGKVLLPILAEKYSTPRTSWEFPYIFPLPREDKVYEVFWAMYVVIAGGVLLIGELKNNCAVQADSIIN